VSVKLFPFWWLKKPPCPSGEQIINGGFETGDFTGWVCTDGWVTTDNPHSGVYCAEIWPSGSRELYQVLTSPIPVYCIASFDFWYRNAASTYFKVVYSDGTSTDWVPLPDVTDWTHYDILPHLDSSKMVSEIHFLNGWVQPLYIDDVSLMGSG